MIELRKDYILDRYVIVSEKRGQRPFEFEKEEKVKRGKIDFFAPGNEHLTPPEIGRLGTKKNWKIRWFENKFAAVKKQGDPNIQTHNDFFTFSSGYGIHEIIVETPDKEKQLSSLPVNHIKDVLSVYCDRIISLSKEKGIRYVCVFKNHGKSAGTSLIHSHSQVIAYNKIPKNIEDKINACKRYDSCPYCRILNIEKESFRRCFETEHFVSFTPYASRFHFENWIFPKQHIRNITDLSQDQLLDLAKILKKVLAKLKKINASYNLELFYSPQEKDLHFHIEITPRLATYGGFEILSEDIINSISPETAAKVYRGEKKIKEKS